MKSIYKFLFALCIFSMSSLMCSAERLLTDLSELKDVKSVYISNTMIKLAGLAGLGNIDGLSNYTSLIKDLKSVEVISVEGKSTVKKRTKKIDKFVKKMRNTNTIISKTLENNKKNALKILEHTNSYGESDGLIVYVKRETSIFLLHLEGSIDIDSLSAF